MANIQYYDVILKPVITEKSMDLMADKKYTFLVHTEATKSQIKEAVEKNGFLGIFMGGFKASAVGISAALIFGYLASHIFEPKMKNRHCVFMLRKCKDFVVFCRV